MNEITLESVMDFDRAFFENNPDRKAYTRKMMPCEIPSFHNSSMLNTHIVLVSMIAEGTRIREFIKHPATKRQKTRGFATK